MNIIEILKRKMNLLRSPVTSNKGFTLIEIMIVVTIMALLTAVVVVPNVTKYLKKAKVDAARMQIRNFQLPLNEFMSAHGNYPASEEGLEALVKDGYLKKVPLDPWGNPYQYRFPGEVEQDEYEIWSFGADGKEGGEAFNTDIKSWEEK
jgi:general secretion pathway protein G